MDHMIPVTMILTTEQNTTELGKFKRWLLDKKYTALFADKARAIKAIEERNAKATTKQ